MIIFNKNPIDYHHLQGYGHLFINVEERYLGQHDSIYCGLEGTRFAHTINDPKVDVADLFKKLSIPDDLVKYYPKIEFVAKNTQGSTPNNRIRALVPCDDFKKYIIDIDKAKSLLNIFRTNVPSEFAKIGQKTIERFTHIINKDRGADISIIHLFTTEFSVERGSYSWNTWYKNTKFIVTDNLMNPIDVDALIEVINKICVPQ